MSSPQWAAANYFDIVYWGTRAIFAIPGQRRWDIREWIIGNRALWSFGRRLDKRGES